MDTAVFCCIAEGKHGATRVYVTLEPGGRQTGFQAGATLREILTEHDIFFAHPCGGRGSCGHCRVEFWQDAPRPTKAEQQRLSKEQLARGVRLSCCTQPKDGSVVTLIGAEQSQFAFDLGEELTVPVTVDPAVSKLTLNLPLPTLDNQGDFLARAMEQLRMNGVAFEGETPRIPRALLSRIPASVQARQGLVTLTYDGQGLVEWEPGDTREQFRGMAIDIGTTTVAARLVDLHTGTVQARSATLNSQSSLGVDVINRIEHCRRDPQGLHRLQEQIQDDLRSLLKRLLADAAAAPETVAQVTIIGNATMMHLLLGVDPLSIALSPYTPVWTRTLRVSSETVGLSLASGCEAIIGPAVSAYVGADILAGVIASSIAEQEKMSLLIDVGTNGEIVLGNRKRLMAAATAAGPAFEGAQISCGTWAAPGAIDQVVIDDSVQLHTLEEAPPIGLCGTGLVDVTAALLRHGVVHPGGKMLKREDIAQLPAHLADRLTQVNGQPAFYLADSQGEPLHLTAGDIRQVQLAKGALQAGVKILLQEMDITFQDIEQVFLAGSFGQKLQVPNLQRLGLLAEIDPAKIRGIGNSALAGAQLMLLSKAHRRRMEELRGQIEYVELSAYEGFADAYSDALPFPTGEEHPQQEG